MSFNARYSNQSARLNAGRDDAWQVHDEAVAMQQRGEDVVLLSIGDPDFRTPEPIIDNAVSHLRVGRTHYSPPLGEIGLRRAVADYETRCTPRACDPGEVSVFPGVTSAIYATLSCLLNPGEEIVVVDPLYVGYEPIMQALDVTVRRVESRAENRFVPQLADFKSVISEATRVVLVNTPGNPTGSIMPADLLRQLAAYCRQRNIWVVCDEVYSMFTYEQPHTSLRSAAEEIDNVVVIDGLSKSHAMSGWRVGWVIAPQTLTEHLGRFSAMSLFGSPQFIQDAAAFALNNDEYYVAEMCDRYQQRRDRVSERLDAIEGISFLTPQSGMFILVDISAIDADDVNFAKSLLGAERVSLLPGSAFGRSTRGHVRLSLVQPMDVLMQGCERLARFAESHQQG